MQTPFLRGPMAAAALFLTTAGQPQAHHGVTGQYDASQPIVLSGTLVEATFAPPHPVLTVRVDDAGAPEGPLGRPVEYFGPVITRPEDLGAELEVEMSPVRMFYDIADRVVPGDRITLVVLRNCLPPHQLRSTWMILPDGDVISYGGDWAPGVDGCS